MNLSALFNNGVKAAKQNAPEILTAVGITGVITTVYFTAKGSFQAGDKIRAEEAITGTASDRKERLKQRTKLVWKCYIPAGVSAVATVACVVGSNKASSQRTAAAMAAYSLTEKAFTEYKEKVVETVKEGKEQKIRDEIVQDQVIATPPKEVFVFTGNEVLCCEMLTGRYFKSNMEALRKAENKVNSLINNYRYVTLNEFYDIIGVWHTEHSSKLGWDSDRLMELDFTSTITPDGQPCLCFNFNYIKPIA